MTSDREKLIELMIEAKKADTEDAPFSEFLADFLLANGVTVQQWISVEDRLPRPEENPVLAVFYGVVNPAWCCGGKWELPSHFITDDVTHWMPLPTPPKEDTPCTSRNRP